MRSNLVLFCRILKDRLEARGCHGLRVLLVPKPAKLLVKPAKYL